MASKLEEVARHLFVKLGDSISKVTTELCWRDAKERRLSFVRLSTDEHSQEDKPWKDIFYVKFFFDDGELPILVGVGSLTRNQIWLKMDFVPEEFWVLLHDKFLFSVIVVRETLDEIKKDFSGQAT